MVKVEMMEINKFYYMFGDYVKIFFLIYDDKGIGVEINIGSGEYLVDIWNDVHNSLYNDEWKHKFDLTQPRRDAVEMIFSVGDLFL